MRARRDNEGKSSSKAVGGIVTFVAFIGGMLVMRALPGDVKLMVVAGGLAGCVVGLLPFFVAKSRGRKDIAGWGLGASILAGLALGLLLAVPVALVFTAVALGSKPKKDSRELRRRVDRAFGDDDSPSDSVRRRRRDTGPRRRR